MSIFVQCAKFDKSDMIHSQTMETDKVSETLDLHSELTQMTAPEDSVTFSCFERLKSYTLKNKMCLL
jgi:hypothetical protein